MGTKGREESNSSTFDAGPPRFDQEQLDVGESILDPPSKLHPLQGRFDLDPKDPDPPTQVVSRRQLLGLSIKGVGALGLLGAAWVALRPSDSVTEEPSDSTEPVEGLAELAADVLTRNKVVAASGITDAERSFIAAILDSSNFSLAEFFDLESIRIERPNPGSPILGTARRPNNHGFPGRITLFITENENRTEQDWVDLFLQVRGTLAHEAGHQWDFLSDEGDAVRERIEFGDGLVPNETRIRFSSIVGLPEPLRDPWFISGDFNSDPPGSSMWAEYVGKLLYDTPLNYRSDVAQLEGPQLQALMEWLAYILEIPRSKTDFLANREPLSRLPYSFISDLDQQRYQAQQVDPWLQDREIEFTVIDRAPGELNQSSVSSSETIGR